MYIGIFYSLRIALEQPSNNTCNDWRKRAYITLDHVYGLLYANMCSVVCVHRGTTCDLHVCVQSVYTYRENWHIARNVSTVFALSLTHSLCFDKTSQHQPMRGRDSRIDQSQRLKVWMWSHSVLLLSLCVWEQASSSSSNLTVFYKKTG